MQFLQFIFAGLTRDFAKAPRNRSHTKKGPGRRHIQGKGKRKT